MSSVVWSQMDEADPRSPFSFLSCRCRRRRRAMKKGSKRGGGGRGRYATVQQDQDDGDDAAVADAAQAEDFGLLWRMWRVTKPLVGRTRFVVVHRLGSRPVPASSTT